jgi:hypothetical protein
MEEIQGPVPGDLTLRVSIRYLRKRFHGDGTGFLITLHDCTLFQYEPYDEPAITDLAAIQSAGLEILSAEPDDPLPISCVMGSLFVRYSSASVALDTGGAVSLTDLQEASRSYWREWSERNRTVS